MIIKRTLLLLAGCLLFVSASAQRQSSFIDEPANMNDARTEDHKAGEGAPKQAEVQKGAKTAAPSVTREPSLYKRVPKNSQSRQSTFMPDNMAQTDSEGEYSRIGHRVDIPISLGGGVQEIKTTGKDENYFKIGLAPTVYLVFPNKKDALGLTLDFSFDKPFNMEMYSYNLLVGPAYSRNFTPFSSIHVCLDLAGGYMFKSNRVLGSVVTPEYVAINHVNQHTLGLRAGVSALKWSGALPVEFRLNFYMPFGPSLLMSGEDKEKIDAVFGSNWSAAVSLGVRLGKY